MLFKKITLYIKDIMLGKVDPLRCTLMTQIFYIVMQCIMGIPFVIYASVASSNYLCFANNTTLTQTCNDIAQGLSYSQKTPSVPHILLVYFFTNLSILCCSTICIGIISYLIDLRSRNTSRIPNYMDGLDLDDTVPYYKV